MGKKIIVFDDDKDILLVTATILKRSGYEVACREDCTNLEADLTAFEPDIILMDNWMPDMNGVDAIQFIKAHNSFKNIPVIFFSANSNVELLAKEAGADSLLKKPFDMVTLRDMLTKMLGA